MGFIRQPSIYLLASAEYNDRLCGAAIGIFRYRQDASVTIGYNPE
jgi:hypothetical protein